MSTSHTARRAMVLGATLTALAAGAAGCGSSSSDSSSSAPAPAATSTAAAPAAAAPAAAAALTPVKGGAVQVAYRDYSIAPADIVVKAGTKIVWTNYDPATHNVITKDGAPEAFKSADFGKGKGDTFTPTKPGVYPYLCTFHAGSMQGKITVQ